MNVRHTLVLPDALLRAAAGGESSLVARRVATERGALLIAVRRGRQAVDGEFVVPLGTDGLAIKPTSIEGVLPGPQGPVRADAVRVVGDRWRLLLPRGDESEPDLFDRQIRAFGSDGQRSLSSLRVGVVGAGGTGSSVFEQLVRLGVGEILVVDPDIINEDGSNVTRVYGSTLADVGQPKVLLAERQATRIGFATKVDAVAGTINDEATARMLRDCDVIFGCTDDNRGRVTLGRISTWYLIPIIDMGVKLTSDDGLLRNIEGRVTVIVPGSGCLQCRGRISTVALQSEVLNPVERALRLEEGYAAGLLDRDPAVIPYTTGVAAYAVSEMLHRIFALDADRPSSELIVRFHHREIRRNSRRGVPGHWCIEPDNLGAGDVSPFLGTTWTT